MTATVVALRDRAPQTESTKANVSAFAFSKTAIRKAVEQAGDTRGIEFRDDGCRGLVLRRQKRDWVFGIKRKINGKVRRATIERWTGSNDVLAVRADAERIMSDMKNGTFIPAKAKAAMAIKSEARTNTMVDLATMTIVDAVGLHGRVNPQIRPKTLESYRYVVRLLAAKGIVRMADITPQTLREVYQMIEADTSVETANVMLRSVSALWNTWATEHPEDQEPTRNPATAIRGKRKGVMRRGKTRDNALRPNERRAWFDAALRMETTTSRALAFIFLTGLRRNEAFALPWSGVDLDANLVTIQANMMKGGVELIRPITPAMRSLLNAQRNDYPHSEFVFPSGNGSGPLIEPRKALAKVNAGALEDGRSITIHDLRRTYIAAAALAGIPDVGLKMLVGHSISDVTEGYQTALRSELPAFALRVEAELLGEQT